MDESRLLTDEEIDEAIEPYLLGRELMSGAEATKRVKQQHKELAKAQDAKTASKKDREYALTERERYWAGVYMQLTDKRVKLRAHYKGKLTKTRAETLKEVGRWLTIKVYADGLLIPHSIVEALKRGELPQD